MVENETDARVGTAERLKHAIQELRALQGPLTLGEVDQSVLEEFREALNRLRNAAWAAQQSAAAQELGQSGESMASFMAAERVRAAYQLCRTIQEDVQRDDIDFKKGNLAELRTIAQEMVGELDKRSRKN